jgi:geranylgeranyl reductase family protein
MSIDATRVAEPREVAASGAHTATMSGRNATVVVVGGGPAGSATAFFLARAGADVILLDRARFPRDKPCAEYLSPQAGRILQEMGALAELEAAPHAELSGMRVRSPRGTVMRGDFSASHGYSGFRDRGLAIRRTILDAVLLEKARGAGARVIEGARVSGLLRDTNGRVTGVAALDAEGHTISFGARIVIGADGLRSVVARRLGLTRAMPWPRRLALVTHYRGVAGMSDVGEMHVERDGYAGLADVGDGLVNVAVVVPSSEVRAAAADRVAYLRSWLGKRPQLAERFAGAERSGQVLATGPFASHVRRAWAPGAALVGDAADFFDPFTGEGIYAALRGGEMLASHLAGALDAGDAVGLDESLRAYEGWRRTEFGGKWMVERMVGLAVGFPPLINRIASVLARRKEMADLLVGVTGDFVPAREVLRPRFLAGLLLG